jgi:hypothetical protein
MFVSPVFWRDLAPDTPAGPVDLSPFFWPTLERPAAHGCPCPPTLFTTIGSVDANL